MNEYVLIKEALRAELHKLMKLECLAEEQKSLLELTENFSSLSARTHGVRSSGRATTS
jgi:hypothetical protein